MVKQDSGVPAETSKGLLRNKIPELKLALEGRVTEHHRFLLKEMLHDLRHVESKMTKVEAKVDKRLRPFKDEVERLCTIPGVDKVTAWGLLSEIGLNMEQFPTAGHLASWAGMCPGNFESVGERLSGKTRKGSAFLRRHLGMSGNGPRINYVRVNYWTGKLRTNETPGSYHSNLFRSEANGESVID